MIVFRDFLSHSRILHSFWKVPIFGEKLQFFNLYSALMSNEGPLSCHTHTCCRAFCSGVLTTCINEGGLLRLEFKHLTFRMRGKRLIPIALPPWPPNCWMISLISPEIIVSVSNQAFWTDINPPSYCIDKVTTTESHKCVAFSFLRYIIHWKRFFS